MDTNTGNEKGLEIRPTASENDPFLVTFSAPYDTDNPKDWKLSRKCAITGVLSATGFNRIMISTIMAPALPAISKELQMNNVESVMALSVYLLATAFGPLVLGPLSELYGRVPVLHATNIWFLAWNIVCGFAKNKETLIAARFLGGFGASAIYALAGGVLGDVWPPEQRGRSTGLYILVPLFGAAAGPIIGGFVAEKTSWRWIFWSTSALQGALVLLCFWMFRETHAPTILRHKAARLRRTLGNEQYYTTVERLEAGRSVSWVMMNSLSRPIRLLLFHPIIQVQAIISSFNYGILYIVLSTFSNLWTTQYHESLSMSGLHYLAMCLGEVTGAELGGPLLDIYYHKMKKRAGGAVAPEVRLPLMLPAAFVASAGLFMYGWAAEARTEWIVVDIGAFILSFGMQIGGQCQQAYVIDAYPDHTSSAAAAAQFLRSMTAFGFPLFAPKMYSALGYGWGNSTLAFAGLAICIPAPLFVWKYGAKLRERAQSSY